MLSHIITALSHIITFIITLTRGLLLLLPQYCGTRAVGMKDVDVANY